MSTQDAPQKTFCGVCVEEGKFPPRKIYREMEPFHHDDKLGWFYKCPVCDRADTAPPAPELADMLTPGPK